MSEDNHLRRRALRKDVVEARLGRRAVQPLSDKLMEWHRATALLAARVSRAELRDQSVSDMLPEIELLSAEVEFVVGHWRQELKIDDVTGRVLDAEKCSQAVLDNLATLRSRVQFALGLSS